MARTAQDRIGRLLLEKTGLSAEQLVRVICRNCQEAAHPDPAKMVSGQTTVEEMYRVVQS
jgi:hypothetical protein